MDNNTREPNNIPSKEFDKEYATQWKKEMLYLRDKGIEYTYFKHMGEYRIPTYKYRKTPQLFLALAEFYNQVRFRSTLNAIDNMSARIEKPEDAICGTPLEKGCIDIQPDENEKKLFEEKKSLTKQELIEKLQNMSEISPETVQEIQNTIQKGQDDTI